MLFCLGNVTHLLDVTPSNLLPHPLTLPPILLRVKFKVFVAKQHPTNTHTHTHMHSYTHSYAHMHSYTHTHTHMHTHTRTYTHTHTLIHTQQHTNNAHTHTPCTHTLIQFLYHAP